MRHTACGAPIGFAWSVAPLFMAESMDSCGETEGLIAVLRDRDRN
jgi:hypothetical protein